LVNSRKLFGLEIKLSDVLDHFSRIEDCAGRNGGRFLEYVRQFGCPVRETFRCSCVRPRAFMSCKAHDDDDDGDEVDDMILFKYII